MATRSKNGKHVMFGAYKGGMPRLTRREKVRSRNA